MTREQVMTAVREGLPFLIRMADGEKHKVSDPFQIALGKTYVVVIGPDGNAHCLPPLTMTGISYLNPGTTESRHSDPQI